MLCYFWRQNWLKTWILAFWTTLVNACTIFKTTLPVVLNLTTFCNKTTVSLEIGFWYGQKMVKIYGTSVVVRSYCRLALQKLKEAIFKARAICKRVISYLHYNSLEKCGGKLREPFIETQKVKILMLLKRIFRLVLILACSLCAV